MALTMRFGLFLCLESGGKVHEWTTGTMAENALGTILRSV